MDAKQGRRAVTEVEKDRCIAAVVRVTVATKARYGRRLAIPRFEEEASYSKQQEA